MSWLDNNWFQRALNALKATFDTSAEKKAAMVQFLYDEGFYNNEKLTWEGAIARFNACLNPNKGEFFKFTEVWALMKRFNMHALFLAMAEDLGYEVRRKHTEERKQDLLEQQQIQTRLLLELLQSTNAELARIGSSVDTFGVVHPAIREGRATFSLPETTECVSGQTNRGF